MALFFTPKVYAEPAINTIPDLAGTSTIDESPISREMYSDMVKQLVINEFGSSSPMVDVARCESGFRQYDSSGHVLTGKVNSGDKGVFQINTQYHLDKSIKMGYDIFTVEGNIAYARYLYDHQGLKPWSASSKCWQ